MAGEYHPRSDCRSRAFGAASVAGAYGGVYRRTNSRVNILDENIIDSQRQRLRHWRIAVRHMGYDVGRQGMKDQEILTVLHSLRRPTFFTRDEDFYTPRFYHFRFCLVFLVLT